MVIRPIGSAQVVTAQQTTRIVERVIMIVYLNPIVIIIEVIMIFEHPLSSVAIRIVKALQVMHTEKIVLKITPRTAVKLVVIVITQPTTSTVDSVIISAYPHHIVRFVEVIRIVKPYLGSVAIIIVKTVKVWHTKKIVFIVTPKTAVRLIETNITY